MTLIAPHRPVRTYTRRGRETYADTGREINVGRGTMICGYCDEHVAWAHGVLRYVQLNGDHTLGIERATGKLVVMAEGEDLKGREKFLPHHCDKIPDDVKAEYQPEIDAWRAAAAAAATGA